MELFFLSIINGLIQGGFFALFAVGLVLIFGVMGVVNFAHGELVMVGAYTIWLVHAQHGFAYIPTLVLAILVVTAIGMLMERFLFRPTRNDPLAGLICSIGVLFILQVIATLVGGEGRRSRCRRRFPARWFYSTSCAFRTSVCSGSAFRCWRWRRCGIS